MASNVKKLGMNNFNIRGKLTTKKKIGVDESQQGQDYIDGGTPTGVHNSHLPGVFKSYSSSSIPGTSSLMRRSGGLGVAGDQGSTSTIDTQQMDQDMVLALTQDVRAFSDYLAKLHNVVYKRSEVGEALRVTAHERLGEVLCILKTILKKYPPVNSTDLLTSTGILISKIKGCNYHDAAADLTELKEAIDQLALSFSSSSVN